VVLALINFSSAGHLIAVIVFFVAMNILVTTLISPKIFATATNLHPLLVLLALFIGGHIMGMMGMIIAIPLAIVVQTLLRAVFDTYIQEI
jgi:predicted PurR-regulated permease PerM